MSSLNWNQRNIIALFVSTFCWGVYTMLFGAAVYALLSPKQPSHLRWRFLAVTVSLYALSTAQAVLMFWQAFVSTDLESDVDSAVLLHEHLLFDIGGTIGGVIIPIANLIADGLLTWRCYVLWYRRFIVLVVPIILLLTGTACGLAQAYFSIKLYLIRLHIPADVTEPPPNWWTLVAQSNAISVVVYVCSCVTNLLMSGLIGTPFLLLARLYAPNIASAFRIWKATQGFGKRKGAYTQVAFTVLETGVLYAICLLLTAIWSPLQQNSTSNAMVVAINVITSILQQLVGIFPTVIILLVALGKSSEQTVIFTERSDYQRDDVSSIHFAGPPATSKARRSVTREQTIELQDTDTVSNRKAEEV
ncbi:hypothetical protein OE88DRAFT_1805742 [Heliocybe sulcata]|uniref:Uncharacterized protein n=1 Tax=Heliocybe sulcata TaxID=5364 RepID=A0A5C3N7V7_9AGAM|nr:hypothetical protein OE88DRAFT_1805742 [Heliocybe sulcata]